MNKFIFILLVIISDVILLGCSRAIPKPGDAVMQLKTHTVIGDNDLATKTLNLTVTQASGALAYYHDQALKIEFSLPNEYTFYNLKPVKARVSHGIYRYSLDFYQIDRGELNLEGDHGLNISLLFTTNESGTFYAQSNQPTAPNFLRGYFSVTP